MGKVLLINGSPNEYGCTYTALHEVEGALHRNGIETELLWLGRKPVAGCIACNTCAGPDAASLERKPLMTRSMGCWRNWTALMPL